MSRRPVPRPKRCACTEAALPVERDELPADSLSCLVVAVLEALLFERGQIPCVVTILRRLESQAPDEEEAAQRRRQRPGAQRQDRSKFLVELQAVADAIKAAVEHASVRSVVLMFGATTVSANEVYEIDISRLRRCEAGEPAVNNEKLCRFSLLGLLAGHIEWSKKLKPAKRIMRASILLNILQAPPEHLELRPVRALRIPRAAVHVRFTATGPDHSSREQDTGCDGGSEGVPSVQAIPPSSVADCKELVSEAESASHGAADSSLTGMMANISLSSVSDNDGGCASAAAADSGRASECEKEVTWYQIPVTLKGFSGAT